MKQKLLFLLTALCFGLVSGVKAQDVPTPVYSQDFESASTEKGSAGSNFGIIGATLAGEGSIGTGDALFGKYYINMPNASTATQRSTYLKIVPTSNPWSNLNTAITTGLTPTYAFTISMWVNTKVGNSHNLNGYWSPLMIACKDNDGTVPTHPFGPQLLACGGIHINSNGWCDYQLDDNDDAIAARDNIYNNGLATDGWHHIVWVFSNLNTTSFGYTIYIDGKSKYSTTLTFNGTNALGMLNDLNCIVLGSTATAAYWDWSDNAFAYDEIAIYDQALTADQVAAIIEAKKCNYTIKAVDGSDNELKELASGEGVLNTAVNYDYPRWVLNGTTLYSSGTGAISYRTNFTLNADNYVKKITYNSGTVSNVVFYTEGEDVAGASIGTNTARASRGQMGYTANATTYIDATTLSPGKYQIYMRAQNGNQDARDYNFKVGGNVVFTGSFANGTNRDANSDEFTIYETSTLSFASAGSSKSGIDYFYVVKTGDATTIDGTIPSSGYGSLATPYGLDFAKATGLTAAFVVSEITKTAVRLTSVDELPAGSGVILKGTPGATYSIPVKADASYDGTNKLHAAVTAYDCAANEVYILQGGLFHLVTAASTVPAGKAYLLAADVPNEARSLIISDEEDPTAISAIEAAESEAGALKDGKYLIDGKIIIVKNGVKYSANGQILK